MGNLPQVTLGVIQFGDDRNLTPVVCLDCSDIQAATQLASQLLALQNGAQTIGQTDVAFTAGDTAIKVNVHRHPERPREAVLAAVHVQAAPTHLTEAFYAASTVEADPATLFRFMQQTVRHFVLTVSASGQPLCNQLYLIKYNLVWHSPVESSLP